MQKTIRLFFILLSGAGLLWAQNNWPVYGHGPGHSGWARNDRAFANASLKHFGLLWKAHLPNKAKSLIALTAPLVAAGVTTAAGVKTLVFTAGSSGTLYAVDAASGKVVWRHQFAPSVPQPYPGMWLCPNGLNATPVIDLKHRIIYVLAADGRLYGLGLGRGSLRWGPVQWVPPYAKTWSLNYAHGWVYTSISQGCGDAASGVYAMHVSQRQRPEIRELLVSNGGPSGVWGRGGPTLAPDGRLYAATGDGPLEPRRGWLGSSIIAATPQGLRRTGYFAPPNWRFLTHFDLDLGATSVAWLSWQRHAWLAAGGKGGTLYLVPARPLGGADHHTLRQRLRLANDQRAYEAKGIWGALSHWRDAQGREWLYVPVWGPVSKMAPHFPRVIGNTAAGSLMAFRLAHNAKKQVVLKPVWMAGGFAVPDPAAIADGLVFALSTGENVQQTQGAAVKAHGHYGTKILSDAQREAHTHHAVLRVLNARTGKLLYQSGGAIATWTHFSGLAVVGGRVFVVDHGSNIYCFGLRP